MILPVKKDNDKLYMSSSKKSSGLGELVYKADISIYV